MRYLVLILLVVFLVVVTTACEPILTLDFSNQTDHTLTIFIRGYQEEKWFEIDDIEPNENIRRKTIPLIFSSYFIEARDSSDYVLYSKEFTFKEIDELDYKIVIPPLHNKLPRS
jgi:hypothetical protein